VDPTSQFAADPMLGIEKIDEMFDRTFQSMDAIDSSRTKAIDVMGQNNQLVRATGARRRLCRLQAAERAAPCLRASSRPTYHDNNAARTARRMADEPRLPERPLRLGASAGLRA